MPGIQFGRSWGHRTYVFVVVLLFLFLLMMSIMLNDDDSHAGYTVVGIHYQHASHPVDSPGAEKPPPAHGQFDEQSASP